MERQKRRKVCREQGKRTDIVHQGIRERAKGKGIDARWEQAERAKERKGKSEVSS
jgi:hypothetical protein